MSKKNVKLREAIKDLLIDLTTIEIGVMAQIDQDRVGKVISYSRIELEGDSIHVLNDSFDLEDKELSDLRQELISTSVQGRKAVRNIIERALR